MRGKGVRTVQLSRLVLAEQAKETALSDLQQGLFEAHDLVARKLEKGEDFDVAIESARWVLVQSLLLILFGAAVAAFGFLVATSSGTKQTKAKAE